MSTASGWDQGQVYYNNSLGVVAADESAQNERIILQKCCQFLEHFRIENNYVYREQLRAVPVSISVELGHLQAFDEQLATFLSTKPAIVMPVFERAARQVCTHICALSDQQQENDLRNLQVHLSSQSVPMSIRDLSSEHIGRLVRIPGIIVSASNVVAKPTNVCIVCRSCKNERWLRVEGGIASVSLPRKCASSESSANTDLTPSQCPLDPYTIVSERSHCVDQQTLKLQELPEAVPVGELPRHLILSIDRSLVNQISPGTRVMINGIYSIYAASSGASNSAKMKVKAVAIRTPFIRILGFQISNQGFGAAGQQVLESTQFDGDQHSEQHLQEHSSSHGHGQDEEALAREMIALSKQPNFYQKFASSIAPSIFGNEDIKKAIACLLVGGSRRRLADGIRLRGDINVLLLGDPGVAKSQLLKFVERVAPISVYTSGKGSSAAGLTASVVRDSSSGDFYLEGGAMVLADGGVVCIDEFDKMDNDDRVAIHEAMEQQTISIAKAGITTILNSRTSVFAAANPVFGRYDELKSPGENIDFSTTILSRFDMIFILKDEHDQARDQTLARHVLAVHMNSRGAKASSSGKDADGDDSSDLSIELMKKYITYVRTKCAPRLSEKAAQKLADHYVSIRGQVHQMEKGERSSIPITVRQLEAIIRISEALAKLALSPVATVEHVDEALRLFRVSTMQAVLSGHSLEGMARPDLLQSIEKVERMISIRLAIGSTIGYNQLVKEMVGKNVSEHSVVKAIDIMVQQEKLLFRSQRRTLVRQF